MDRLSLKAQERSLLGKKVKSLRKDGQLPGHVFGKGLDGENVLVEAREFLKAFKIAGETGLVDLKIETSAKAEGAEKGGAAGAVRPVLIREVQYDPITGKPIHIDFYQVNLSEKVKVSVPLIQIGEQPEVVHLGEAIVLQTLNEIEVEALPTDLPEKIEVDITSLLAIDDAITVAQLNYDKDKLTLHAESESIVIKLAPAVTAEMEKLLEEQAAEQAAKAAEAAEEGGEAAVATEEAIEGAEEGAAPVEGGEQPSEGEKAPVEEKPQEK